MYIQTAFINWLTFFSLIIWNASSQASSAQSSDSYVTKPKPRHKKNVKQFRDVGHSAMVSNYLYSNKLGRSFTMPFPTGFPLPLFVKEVRRIHSYETFTCQGEFAF